MTVSLENFRDRIENTPNAAALQKENGIRIGPPHNRQAAPAIRGSRSIRPDGAGDLTASCFPDLGNASFRKDLEEISQ
jgi:hypothetical protein